jgi:lysophospholipase L1-like esterase
MKAHTASPSRVVLTFLRALAVVLVGYFALSWLTVALYDAAPFSPGYRARYLLLNLHSALVPLSLCLAAILRQVGDFLNQGGGAAVEAKAEASAAESAAGGVENTVARGASEGTHRLERRAIAMWILIVVSGGVALVFMQPVVLSGGTPSLRPSSHLRMDQFSTRPSILVDTNAAGFRDGPWPSAPRGAGGRWRLLLVGDSVVFGSGIRAQDDTLTPVLARRLRASGMPVEVNNLSLLGLNFRQEVDLLERHAAALSPDLVVVLHNGENDLMPELPYYRHPRLWAAFPLSFITYVNALDRWMRAHPLSDSPAAVEGFKHDTERLARLATRLGFDVLFLSLHDVCPPPYFEPPTPFERRFSYALLGNWDERPGLTFPNDFHPTQDGVQWMAERIEPLVRRMRAAETGAGEDSLTAEFLRQCVKPPRGPVGSPSRPWSPAIGAESAPRAVLSPAIEPAARKLLDLDADDPKVGGFKVTSIAISAYRIVGTIESGNEKAEIVLAHPSQAPGARWHSQSFAIDVAPGTATHGPALRALERLADLVIERDRGGFWAAPTGPKETR